MAQQKKADDAGKAEVEKAVEAEQDQGFHGRKVDQEPNSAHSLESGPDAPSVQSQLGQAKEA